MFDKPANSLNNFDIIEFAKSILTEVDSVRSFSSAGLDEKTQQEFNIPTESRVNAFFRLIGLPMFISIEKKGNKQDSGIKPGKQHISSGFFGPKFDNYTVKNIKTLERELVNREQTLSDRENSIGTEEMNRAMSDALKTSMPIVPNYDGKVGVGGTYERKIFKKLFPLVVSYEEDILPKRNEVSRPFVTNENLQQITNNNPLKVPFIETVVRIRLMFCDNAKTPNEEKKIVDVTNSVKSTIGETLYKDISSDNQNILNSLNGFGLLEQHIINKFFVALYQLANTWTRLQTEQEVLYKQIQYSISIKTTSAKRSVFGKRAIVSADILSGKNSTTAQELKKLNEKLAEEEALLSILLPSNDVIRETNNKTANNRNSSLSALTDSFAQVLNHKMEQLRKQIKKIESEILRRVQEAESLRVRLDMITGEFTGLSIVDVMAVITALFMIDKRDLVALLDEHVKEDMRTDSILETALNNLGNPTGFDAAIAAKEKLEKFVSLVFVVFNSYVNVIKNKKLNPGKATKKNRRNRKKNQTTYDRPNGDE